MDIKNREGKTSDMKEVTEQQGKAKRQVTCFNRGKEGHFAREWEQRRFLKFLRERTEQSQLLDCMNDSMKD